MPFTFTKTAIEDVILVEPKVFPDSRGYFSETYKKSEFFANGIDVDFIQDNQSKSSKGVLRGLHYQLPPKAQAKLVRCIRGRIFDVAVDIRKSSSTFGQWVGYELTEANKLMLYIPAGFAHGFVVLSGEAEILYKASNEYSPQHDRGIRWNDTSINVDWGSGFDPIISDKDLVQPFLNDLDEYNLFA